MSILTKISTWYFTRRALPYWGILVLDSLIVLFSALAGEVISVGPHTIVSQMVPRLIGLAVIWSVYMIFFRVFHTYRGVIRFSSFLDLQKVGAASIGAFVIIVCLSFIFKHSDIHAVVLTTLIGTLVMAALSTLLMYLVRVSVKGMYYIFRRSGDTRNVFIYGVREGAVAIAKSIHNMEGSVMFDIKGFVSPDGYLVKDYLMGVKVYPDDDDLIGNIRAKGIQAILVSPLQTEIFRTRETLINNLLEDGIKILMIPTETEEWDGKSPIHHQQLKNVEIEDLLPREKIEVNMDAIGAFLTGKKILITGAAGSIGSEMVRQICVYKPSELVLVDQAETPMHDLRLMMKNSFSDISNETIVCTITDKVQMEDIFSRFKPEYVFHAAAYKHVPMMEDNPAQAVRNNIQGTRIIADLAVKYGAKKFVMISTDKAVNPTNVMGCSKRICEIYCQSLNKAIADGTCNLQTADGCKPVTQFVTTRFGNVLGSNGSVIPIFRDQIRKGGPITVTHPDIIRFFMLIPEACKLVLEAGTMGKGGEIFVFDMGKPVRIVDLAKRMIKLSGAHGIEIKFTGLRDGEKLYEEVLSDQEGTLPTSNPKIRVAKVRECDYATACANEDSLLAVSLSQDDMKIVAKMKEIVPEYKSRVSKYTSLDK